MKVSPRKADPYLKVALSGDLLILSKCGFTRIGSGPGNKSAIKQFTSGSRRGLLRYLRECVADYRIMVTLTYPHGHGFDGAQSKEHLRRFMQELKRRGNADEPANVCRWSGFWIMEFQSRGSIHYHLLTTHRVDYDWVAKTWYRICGTDDKRHEQAGTRVESIRAGKKGVMSYMGKYASKMEQKKVPEAFGWAGRFWGVSGSREVVAAATNIPQGLQSVPAVINRLKAFKRWLKEGLLTGEITKLHTEKGQSAVYGIENKRKRSEAVGLMGILRAVVAANSADSGDDWEFAGTGPHPEADYNDIDYLTWGL